MFLFYSYYFSSRQIPHLQHPVNKPCSGCIFGCSLPCQLDRLVFIFEGDAVIHSASDPKPLTKHRNTHIRAKYVSLATLNFEKQRAEVLKEACF